MSTEKDEASRRERSEIVQFFRIVREEGMIAAVRRGFARIFTWKRIRWALVMVTAVLTVIVLFYAVENWRGARAWRQASEAYQEAGGVLDARTLLPPQPPDEENMAAHPWWAAMFDYRRDVPDSEGTVWTDTNALQRIRFSRDYNRSIPGLGAWQKGEETDLRRWLLYYRGSKDGSEAGLGADREAEKERQMEALRELSDQEVGEALLKELREFDPLFLPLKEASRRPDSQFPIHYEENWAALLPHLSPLRELAQFTALHGLAAGTVGDAGLAFDDLEMIWRLADGIRTEPLLISQLVRMAILSFGNQLLWEGCREHWWSSEQLARTTDRLRELNLLQDYHSTLKGEMVMGLNLIELLKEMPVDDRLRMIDGWGGGEADRDSELGAVLFYSLAPGGWYNQARSIYARAAAQDMLTPIEERPRMVSRQRLDELDEFHGLVHAHPLHAPVLRLITPAHRRAAERIAEGQAGVHSAIVAAALERHFLDKQRYPETLEGIVPKYLEDLPPDPFTGGQLVYSPAANGHQFVLYSVGSNFKDDGGKADREEGDIVWRSEASDAVK